MKYSKEEKEWLVEEWGKSGKSKCAFAKELGLNVQTLINWTKGRETGHGFIEISGKIEKEAIDSEKVLISAGNTPIIREMVVERGDITIRLPLGVTQAELAFVIQALR
jgi:transposase-like protein